CQSGFNVDLSTLTDIVAKKGKETFFVECKRVASRDLFLRRLKEAKNQISERLPSSDFRRLNYGVIAIDVTKACFSHNGLTLGITNEHSKDVIQDELTEIAGKFDAQTLWDGAKNVSQIWLQIHIPTIILNPFQ